MLGLRERARVAAGTTPPGARGATGALVRSERGRWDTFYPAFATAVRGQGDVPVPARDAIATATILDVARLCATGGGTIHLS